MILTVTVLESTESTPLNDITTLSATATEQIFSTLATTTDDHTTSSFGLQISTNGGIPISDVTILP